MNFLRLYPKAWRERYGDELEALLEDAPAGNFNVLKGAIAMRLKYLPGWAIVAVFAITGWLAGLGSSYLVTQKWESAAVLRITPTGVIAENVGAQAAYDLATAQNELMRRIQAEFPAREILIRPTPWPLLTPGYIPKLTFIVDSRYPDPVQAKAVAEKTIAKIVSMSRADLDIAVLDPPSLPRRPMFPNRPFFAVLGLAVGVILATATMLVRRITQALGTQTA